MDLKELDYYYSQFKYSEDSFHDLMKHRVRRILLISTFYDAYIFEHDTKLSDQIVGDYHQLNLTSVPRIITAPTGQEAKLKLEAEQFDLIITTVRIADMSVFTLCEEIKKLHPGTPILLLLTTKTDINLLHNNEDKESLFNACFLWQGDSKLLLAMIKFIEDQMNVKADIENGLVRVILLVEDSIPFYSTYLPLLYTEIMELTQRLIEIELNDQRKYNLMRTRPKVLLAKNYEEADALIKQYQDSLLGVISDIEYKRGGEQDTDAGIWLFEMLKNDGINVPVLLQSSDESKRERVNLMEAHFLHKKSNIILQELRSFILKNFGFGDFFFRRADGSEIERATTLNEFIHILKRVPIESIIYHSDNNHFSTWLIARGQFLVAERIRPMRTSDFNTAEDQRNFLVNVFYDVKRMQNRGKIIDFRSDELTQSDVVIRMGKGSLGGKGRGLAFMNALLVNIDLNSRYDDVNILIPKTAIIGTEEYDKFITKNNLTNLPLDCGDQCIKARFVHGELSDRLKIQLREYLKQTTHPIAVRSSGLLEDSQSQPFAGVYQTFMLPNNHYDLETRYRYLIEAVKLVFSSVYLAKSVNYIENLNYGIEEEKMAVIIQELVGQSRGTHFYPHFSGVAQSYNYYPIGNMSHDDGAASLAVGLGQAVVGGERIYMFCPRYPELHYGSLKDLLRTSQDQFYALDMSITDHDLSTNDVATLVELPMEQAEKDGALTHLASTWDHMNSCLVDGISEPGKRVISFANILKYEYFPLAKILKDILAISEIAMGQAVEIEFAVDLTKDHKKNIFSTFYLLQVRPMAVSKEEYHLEEKNLDKSKLVAYCCESFGNGTIEDITDIVYIPDDRFDKTKTMSMQKEIAAINKEMQKENRGYILIAPGRWGSRDRFLGIPVLWSDINRAKVIIETGLEDFDIEPSQGSHFFHNLVAMNVGYFNIPFHNKKDSFLDINWLNSQKAYKEGLFFRHLKLENSLTVYMDGKNGISAITKDIY